MACDDGPPLESPQRLARQLNLLLAGERLEKQRALDFLVAEAKNERTTEEEVRMLLRPSLAALDSRTEACRSRSLRLVSVLLDRLPPTRDDLPLLVPALSRRLSPVKPAEPAEELRLELVRLLSRVVALRGPDLGPYVGDFVTALCRCMLDPFAEVKKEACRCATNLANAIPGKRPHSIPGKFPHSVPGNLPHSVPGNLPHSVPGKLPHSVPGKLPHSLPG